MILKNIDSKECSFLMRRKINHSKHYSYILCLKSKILICMKIPNSKVGKKTTVNKFFPK